MIAMGMSGLQNMIFTYHFTIVLSRIFKEGGIEWDTFAATVKYMFAGAVVGFLSIKDIVELYIKC